MILDFSFILIGLSIMWLFMFKIEWLFSINRTFWILLIYCLFLFGLSLYFLYFGYFNPKTVVFLRMPIISLGVFKVLYWVFNKIYKRKPENTAWVMVKKPIQDVIFSILFWFLGVVFPILIVSFLKL